MMFRQFTTPSPKLTVWNKLSLMLWIVACLALLSFFTFTLFVIALLAGVVILTLKFFRRGPGPRFPQANATTTYQTRIYRSDRPRDDDIIDV